MRRGACVENEEKEMATTYPAATSELRSKREPADSDLQACEDLRRHLVAALDLPEGDARRTRLSIANTSVTFMVEGCAAATVLLDRDPPRVAGGIEPAEITVHFTAEAAASYGSGAVALGPVLLAGEVTCHGPIRKYLMVDSVVRRLLAGADWQETTRVAFRNAMEQTGIQP
jgi:hypothetical protein